MLLRGALLPDGFPRDLLLDGGRVVRVAPPGTLPAGPAETDLTGCLLLPAPAEPHAHLDKAHTWDLAGAPPCDLPSAVGAWRDYAERVTEEDVALRARRALDELAMNGATAVRTHVDILPGDDPLRGLRAMLRLREAVRGRTELQIAVLHLDAPDAVLREAFALGADVLGGCPHLAADPEAAVERAVRLAGEFGVGVDLHADENLDPASRDLRLLAAAVRGAGFSLPVTASHCVSLGAMPDEEAARLAKDVAGAGIGVVTLPLTNLYLQGRGHAAPVPRGLTAVRALLDAGVTLAAGGDNVRDPFNPVGRADPLETAALLVAAGHLTPSEAVHAVTAGARAVLGLPPAGPFEGAVADLLAVRAGSLSEALGAACPDRVVFRAGRVVSRTTVVRELA
ncbi:amidohydrolase family protein [Streptomyces hainanensis]|uniref:Cytosine deaminase n=1 Tax=Streptomyces hainanensis TaxID=402648 RepID=A0A4V2Y149_9ACTN|nr:amidohydrolase family protein [Streptomyces hainanensis]TDC67285.1 cytosine deaminase [Streptomyces hainanensis]